MKIAIISDSHDNTVNLEKCLKWCRENMIEALLCCGDVANADSLESIVKNFTGKIFLARGNADSWEDEAAEAYGQIDYLGRNGGVVELGGRRIGLCHEPRFADGLADMGPQMIFYGHTHKPWEEAKDGARLVNPGTLGGVFQKASFAAYDTANEDLQLIILETLSD